jgi:TPR repeat protein
MYYIRIAGNGITRGTATIYLTLFVLLGSVGVSESADFQKGITAYDSGDYETALREFESLAEQGDAYAQYKLGVMYDNGDGVSQDYKTAKKWVKLAAEQGSSRLLGRRSPTSANMVHGKAATRPVLGVDGGLPPASVRF